MKKVGLSLSGKLFSDRELIHLGQQGIGDSVSVLTEINEHFAEEFRIVSAYLIVGQVLCVAFIFENKDFRELFSFRAVERSDKRIEAPAVIEIIIRRSACTRLFRRGSRKVIVINGSLLGRSLFRDGSRFLP